MGLLFVVSCQWEVAHELEWLFIYKFFYIKKLI